MKKLMFIFPLMIGSMLLLCGCPAEVTMPVDEGSYTAPGWMAGNWVDQTNDNSQATYRIENGTGHIGQLYVYKLDSNGNVPKENNPVYLSEIGGEPFLFYYDPGDADMLDDGYYIYKMKIISNSEVILKGVKADLAIEKMKAAELKDYLLTNKDNEDIYDAKELIDLKKI